MIRRGPPADFRVIVDCRVSRSLRPPNFATRLAPALAHLAPAPLMNVHLFHIEIVVAVVLTFCITPNLQNGGSYLDASRCKSAIGRRRTCAASVPPCSDLRSPALGRPATPETIHFPITVIDSPNQQLLFYRQIFIE